MPTPEELKKRIKEEQESKVFSHANFGIPKDLSDAENPNGLSVTRTPLATISVGIMLKKGYSLRYFTDPYYDEILPGDPPEEPVPGETEEQRKERILKKKEAVRKSFGKTTLELFKGKDQEAFGKYAAEGFVEVLKKCKEHIALRVGPDFTAQDLLLPENHCLMEMVTMYQDAGQEIDKGDIWNYAINLPGMSEETVNGLVSDQYYTNNYLAWYCQILEKTEEILSSNGQVNAASYAKNMMVPVLACITSVKNTLKKNPSAKMSDQEVVDKGGEEYPVITAETNSGKYDSAFRALFSNKFATERLLQSLVNGEFARDYMQVDGEGKVILAPAEKIAELKDKEYADSIKEFAETYNAVKSPQHFGLFVDPKEKEELGEYRSRLSIAWDRTGLSTLILGRMLEEGHSLDDIFDPSKLQEEKHKYYAEVKAKYLAACSKEAGGDGVSQEATDEFGKYAARVYEKAFRELVKYIDSESKSYNSLGDILNGSKLNCSIAAAYLQSAAQECEGLKSYIENYDEIVGLMAAKQVPLNNNVDYITSFVIGLDTILKGEGATESEKYAAFTSKVLPGIVHMRSFFKLAGENKLDLSDMAQTGEFNMCHQDITSETEMIPGLKYALNSVLETPKGRELLTASLLKGEFDKDLFTLEGASASMKYENVVPMLNAVKAKASLIEKLTQAAEQTGLTLDEYLKGSFAACSEKVYGEDKKNLEDTINEISEDFLCGREITIYRPETEGGAHKAAVLSLGEDGRSLYEAPGIDNLSKAVLRDVLQQKYDALLATGTTRNDSPEFKNMKTSLADAIKTVDTSNKIGKIKAAVSEVKKNADAYYFAKLDQPHNSRRGKRFDIADEIRSLDEKPRTKTEILLENIAAKMCKAVFVEEAKSDVEYIRTNAEYTLSHKQSFREEVKIVLEDERFKSAFEGKSEAYLKKAFAKNARELITAVNEANPQIAPRERGGAQRKAPGGEGKGFGIG